MKHLTNRLATIALMISLLTALAPQRVALADTEVNTPVVTEPVVEPVFPEAEERQPVREINMVFTAYNSLPGQTDSTPCITANGHNLCRQFAEEGVANTIATNLLPFGTIVTIPELYGDKQFIVRDRMNARYNGKNRSDIWFADYTEARHFGVKRAKMLVWGK